MLFALALLAGFVQGQNWINTSLNNHVSVRFPKKPEIQEFDNVTLFHIADSEYIINVSAADARVSTNFVTNQDSLKNLYHQSLLRPVAANGYVWAVAFNFLRTFNRYSCQLNISKLSRPSRQLFDYTWCCGSCCDWEP